MGMLFDMEKFRQETGMLFVDMDDLKPNTNIYPDTPKEVIGCHKGSWFENAVNFGDHNLHMDVYDVKRPGDDDVVWSYESYVLFDYQYESRYAAAHRVANETSRTLAQNMEDETADGGLLCYTNLWDLRHAGNGLRKEHAMYSMLPDPLKGVYPGTYMRFSCDTFVCSWDVSTEWQSIGRYIDVSKPITRCTLAPRADLVTCSLPLLSGTLPSPSQDRHWESEGSYHHC